MVKMQLLRVFAFAILVCTASSAATKRAKKFLFTGANQAGGEFGSAIPGELGRDYRWPDPKSINTLMGKGMNTFRVGFTMERAIPNELRGAINQTYFQGLEDIVKHITSRGAYAVIDPHNFGRYYGQVITDVKGFGRWWSTVAKRFKSNSRVIFDTNNEYHDMDNSLVAQLNQAAINAIRAAGATSQYIFVEGNSWSGSQSWVSSGNGASLRNLRDPQNKLIYEMHLYLDDTSGTSPQCQSGTIGVERLREATKWLRRNGKRGIIGETAAGYNQQCIKAMRGELQHLLNNSDVWTGWLWWAAGPWWQDYMFSMEPSSGIAYKKFLPHIQEFVGA